MKFAKSAKEAASKVQEQSEIIGKTETFKAVSAVSILCMFVSCARNSICTLHVERPLEPRELHKDHLVLKFSDFPV